MALILSILKIRLILSKEENVRAVRQFMKKFAVRGLPVL